MKSGPEKLSSGMFINFGRSKQKLGGIVFDKKLRIAAVATIFMIALTLLSGVASPGELVKEVSYKDRFPKVVVQLIPRTDGTLTIVEEINVISEGELLKRGIIRKLPSNLNILPSVDLTPEYKGRFAAINGLKVNLDTPTRSGGLTEFKLWNPFQSELQAGSHLFEAVYDAKPGVHYSSANRLKAQIKWSVNDHFVVPPERLIVVLKLPPEVEEVNAELELVKSLKLLGPKSEQPTRTVVPFVKDESTGLWGVDVGPLLMGELATVSANWIRTDYESAGDSAKKEEHSK